MLYLICNIEKKKKEQKQFQCIFRYNKYEAYLPSVDITCMIRHILFMLSARLLLYSS